jgi:hypothetical protein
MSNVQMHLTSIKLSLTCKKGYDGWVPGAEAILSLIQAAAGKPASSRSRREWSKARLNNG